MGNENSTSHNNDNCVNPPTGMYVMDQFQNAVNPPGTCVARRKLTGQPTVNNDNPSSNEPAVQVPVKDRHHPHGLHYTPPAIHFHRGGTSFFPKTSVVGSLAADAGMTWVYLWSGEGNIIDKLWTLTKRVVGGIVWNYTDWVDQFRLWDGTWRGLIVHSHLLWRTVVVGFLTLGILEIVPVIEALGRWLYYFYEFLRMVFGLTGDALSEMGSLVLKIYDDIRYLFDRAYALL